MKKHKRNILRKLLPVAGIFIFSLSAYAQEDMDTKQVVSRADGVDTPVAEFTGAVSTINGESLKTYPDIVLSNALQGRAPGLIVRSTLSGLGNNDAELFIRGNHGNSGNKAIVIIDGIERPIDDLLAEEIESIEILKDASAKILYGPAAANGVLVVKTKRGVANTRVLRASGELGVMMMTRTPEFLNSYQYATLYNEARNNDGLPNLYLPHQLTGYQNSTGANDLLYPNVDYYEYFLKKQSLYRKFTLEANGGNQKFRYAVVAGYLGGDGFEKIGETPDLNRLNLRGNLDIEVTDYLSVVADVAGRMENRTWGAINTAGTFEALSNNHPNEFPMTIAPEAMGITSNEDGVPYFGASLRRNSNLLADLQYRGFSKERYITSQTNVGLDFNFNRLVKGLTASGYMTFDNYTFVRQELRRQYPTYAVRTYLNDAGVEQTEFTLLKKKVLSSDINAADDLTYRSLGWRANVAYQNSFDQHNISAIAGYRYYKNESKGLNQDVINCNYNLRLNYNFDKRYFAEFNLAYMGTNKFQDGNKYFLSPAGSIGWILSNEDFLAGSENINFLKIRAGYGVLGYSGNTGYSLYKQVWQDAGKYQLEGNEAFTRTTELVRTGNPDLKWESSAEFNIGMEGLFLNNRLTVTLDYFNETRSNIIGNVSTRYSALAGPFFPEENMGKIKNQGIDAHISWGEKIGDWQYQVGANVTVSKNKMLEWNESLNIPEEGRKKIGKPTDAIYGLESLGLFGRDVDLNGHTSQSFGPYQEGDIAYVNQNGDNVIDGRDEIMIGNSFPRTSLGIDLNLKYKNWSLYILGTSELGLSKLLDNTYYWNNGESKYSVLANESYHPQRNPNGIYPRLTTMAGNNNYLNSDFWLENASFFRLKNIELSYTFKFKKLNTPEKGLRVYARGSNLFVISKIKDLDPELLNAGITNNPVTAMITGGLSFSF